MQRLMISKFIAFGFAVLIPLGETIRRWNQIADFNYFMLWIDDYILGAILFASAYQTHKNPINGQRYLIATWGIAVGGLFLSFLSQFKAALVEASEFSSSQVAAVKGIVLAICIVCLIFALTRIDDNKNPNN